MAEHGELIALAEARADLKLAKMAGKSTTTVEPARTRAVEMNALYPGTGGPMFPGPGPQTGMMSTLTSKPSFFSAANHVGTRDQRLYFIMKRST